MGRTTPTIIVVGNEKGGSGKSTVAIHIVVGLLHAKIRAGALDLDHRQQTLSHFFANRVSWSKREGRSLHLPRILSLSPSPHESRSMANDADDARVQAAIDELGRECDVIVIDCPGADTALSRAAHRRASTLVTPMNDSFVDFDLLAQVDAVNFEAKSPATYAAFVFECRKSQMMKARKTIDWVVLRNRLSSLDTRNKQRVSQALSKFSKRIGFRLAPGLSERVIYRELFPMGLTVADLADGRPKTLSMSHLAARAEIRGLIASLGLPHFSKLQASG